MNEMFLNDKIAEANGLPVKAIILDNTLTVHHMNSECATFMKRVRLDPKDPNILNALSGLGVIKSEIQKTFHDNSSITKEYNDSFVIGNKTSALKFVVEPKVQNGLVACVLLKIISKQKNQKKAQLIKEKEDAFEEVKATNEQLQKATDLKESMLKDMSHSLRTPLNHVLGFLALTVGEYDELSDEKVLQRLNIINNSAIIAARMIGNVFSRALLDADKLHMSPIKIDLFQKISSMKDLYRLMANSKNIKITKDESLVDVWVDSDEYILDSVLQNLINNCIKFTNKDGGIDISARAEGPDIIVCIADTGIGLSAEDIHKLLNTGERVQTWGTSQERGTGLGIRTCKELIAKQGGKFWIESEVGKGSKFYFTLPSA